jgi:hypothetical protein
LLTGGSAKSSEKEANDADGVNDAHLGQRRQCIALRGARAGNLADRALTDENS